MVVASISLLVALGGTSVAAVNQLAANSVGTSQLKNNAVTAPKIASNAVVAAKIASNAVVAAKIASNAVVTAKLAGNAVTNAKIANGTIQPADLSAAAKTSGPTGASGASGASGPTGPTGPSNAYARFLNGPNPVPDSATTLASLSIPEAGAYALWAKATIGTPEASFGAVVTCTLEAGADVDRSAVTILAEFSGFPAAAGGAPVHRGGNRQLQVRGDRGRIGRLHQDHRHQGRHPRELGLAGHRLTDSDRRLCLRSLSIISRRLMPFPRQKGFAVRSLRKHRPSPAMVVASIALLVALGGTSIAAVSQLAPNTVGALQLKAGSVGTSEVKNRNLLAVDFKQGQLPRGPRGPRGLQGQQGIQGPSGAAGVAAPGYVAQVTSQTSGTPATTTSTSFVNLAGATETIVVPTGETARIYAIFTAESTCTGGASDFCSVRVTVDGNELNPAVGTDYAFDSTDNGDETAQSWESHAIARSSETLAAGNHAVQVQFRATTGASLRLDDWVLVIHRTKLS